MQFAEDRHVHMRRTLTPYQSLSLINIKSEGIVATDTFRRLSAKELGRSRRVINQFRFIIEQPFHEHR